MFVADDDATRSASPGGAAARRGEVPRRSRRRGSRATRLDDLIRASNTHLGTPQHVAATLAADMSLDRATEVAFQVHSVDPPHALILRHIDLLASEVAPQLSWGAQLTASATRCSSDGIR